MAVHTDQRPMPWALSPTAVDSSRARACTVYEVFRAVREVSHGDEARPMGGKPASKRFLVPNSEFGPCRVIGLEPIAPDPFM